MNINMYL